VDRPIAVRANIQRIRYLLFANPQRRHVGRSFHTITQINTLLHRRQTGGIRFFRAEMAIALPLRLVHTTQHKARKRCRCEHGTDSLACDTACFNIDRTNIQTTTTLASASTTRRVRDEQTYRRRGFEVFEKNRNPRSTCDVFSSSPKTATAAVINRFISSASYFGDRARNVRDSTGPYASTNSASIVTRSLSSSDFSRVIVSFTLNFSVAMQHHPFLMKSRLQRNA